MTVQCMLYRVKASKVCCSIVSVASSTPYAVTSSVYTVYTLSVAELEPEIELKLKLKLKLELEF